jgi:hypothetical protein
MKRIKKPTSGNTGGAKYNVGYGKPPAERQFKKGQSGNPRGRPKGRKNLGKSVADVLTAPVNVRMGSREAKMPLREAVLRRVSNDALRGGPRAIADLLALVGKDNIFPTEIEDERAQPTIAEDTAIILDFIERQGAEFFENFHVGNRKQRS